MDLDTMIRTLIHGGELRHDTTWEQFRDMLLDMIEYFDKRHPDYRITGDRPGTFVLLTSPPQL